MATSKEVLLECLRGVQSSKSSGQSSNAEKPETNQSESAMSKSAQSPPRMLGRRTVQF